MTTLKELKAKYPSKISCVGKIYIIDGFGRYYQIDKGFGIETYWQNLDDEYKRISFEKLEKEIKQIWGEEKADGIQ